MKTRFAAVLFAALTATALGQTMIRVEPLTETQKSDIEKAQRAVWEAQHALSIVQAQISGEHEMKTETWPEWGTTVEFDGDFIVLRKREDAWIPAVEFLKKGTAEWNHAPHFPVPETVLPIANPPQPETTVQEQKGNKFLAAESFCSKEGLCYHPAGNSPAQTPKTDLTHTKEPQCRVGKWMTVCDPLPEPEPKQEVFNAVDGVKIEPGTARICDAKGEPADSCVRVFTVKPGATTSSTLTGGTYTWVFTDPNNEYRCFVSSFSWGLPSPDSFTITCVKLAALEPNRTVVTNGK